MTTTWLTQISLRAHPLGFIFKMFSCLPLWGFSVAQYLWNIAANSATLRHSWFVHSDYSGHVCPLEKWRQGSRASLLVCVWYLPISIFSMIITGVYWWNCYNTTPGVFGERSIPSSQVVGKECCKKKLLWPPRLLWPSDKTIFAVFSRQISWVYGVFKNTYFFLTDMSVKKYFFFTLPWVKRYFVNN